MALEHVEHDESLLDPVMLEGDDDDILEDGYINVDAEDEDEEEEEVKPKRKGKQRGRPKGSKNTAPYGSKIKAAQGAAADIAADAADWAGWMEALAGPDSEFLMHRIEPQIFIDDDGERHKTGGWVATYHSPVNPEVVNQEHGGGKYQIRARKRGADGRWKAAGSQTFEIVGVPKISTKKKSNGSGGAEVTLLKTTLEHAEKQRQETERRQEKLEQQLREVTASGGRDALKMMEMMVAQMSEAQRNALAAGKGEDGGLKLFSEYLNNDSARVEKLREMHASELRQQREAHIDELRRKDDSFQRQLDMATNQHTREVTNLQASHAMIVEGLKLSASNERMILQGRIDDLKREIAKVDKELADLKARKDKSPMEHMSELAQMKEGLEALGLTGGGEAEEGIFPKVMGIADNAINMIAARANAAATAPTGPAQQQVAAQQQQMAQMQAAENQGLREAAAFLNAAVGKNSAAEIAAAARGALDRGMLERLGKMDLKEFFARAGVQPGEPLTTQEGRNFLREVQQALLA